MYLCVHVYPFGQSVYRLVPLSPTIAPGKSCKTNRIIITHGTDAWHLFIVINFVWVIFPPMFCCQNDSLLCFFQGNIPQMNVWYSKLGFHGQPDTMFQRKNPLVVRNLTFKLVSHPSPTPSLDFSFLFLSLCF